MTEFLNLQNKNAFLWVPFVLAFGAALYFSCASEPNFHFPIIITALLAAIIYRYKNVFIRTLALFLFGFFYAMSFTHILETPQIRDSLNFVDVVGTVKGVDYSDETTRILLNVPKYKQNIKSEPINANFRLTIKNNLNIPTPGDTISARIKTFHAPGKYVPASFDFARWSYFNKISGTGFFEKYEIVSSDKARLHLRTYIHNKSKSMLTDALVLGYKQSIPLYDSQIWKSVGVGHIWAISGFHMGLVGGWLFVFFYFIFRSVPYITKRIPAKYPATICAWLGLIFYLCISGISVSTVRAFLMTTLIFGAMLLGRGVFSLRNGALAFIFIFLINPFFVMNAGFQLSFAAVFGLLWFFDEREYIKRSLLKRTLRFMYLSLMTAVIATVFTLPFIIAHFGYVPIYSLLGNIIILPIFSVLIMPLIMIGTICTLFGNFFIIKFTHGLYYSTLSIAHDIANLPYANLPMPPISNSVLMLSIFGLIFLILVVKPDSKKFFVRNINYVLCIACIACATVIASARNKPLFYATENHSLVGFVVDGKLKFNKSSDSNNYFAFNTWRNFNGEESSDKNEKYKCDHGICVYKTQHWTLVYMQDFIAIMNNIEKTCADKSVNFIVAPFEISAPKCHAKILKNGLMIYPNGSVKEIVNRRPWNNLH